MARLNKTWQAGEDHSALAAELHRVLGVSHRQAKGIIDAGCVRVNGEMVHTHGHRTKAGDEIAVAFDPDTTYQELPPPKTQMAEAGFKILWEDKHLVFVDKPAGLLTVPSESGREECLAEAITEHYRRRGFKRFQLYIVHRLDRFSSGVLVFAKTPEALHGLKKLFETHHLNRVYKAILVGEIPENAGTLTGKLIEHAKSLKMAVVQPRKNEPKGAKHAITHFRVLERLPGHTVVEVRLETGRRNQIRVQFADRGYPLLGDQVYGEESPILDRQALHAELLGFRHPVTDESLTVSTPLPTDMERALKILRNQRRVERAEAGVTGEEGIYKPKITKGRKFERVLRANRFGTSNGDERKPDRDSGRDTGRDSGRPVRPRAGFGPRRTDDEAPAKRSFGRPERPDRSERPERSGRFDRSERPERPTGDRPERKPRAAGTARPERNSERPGFDRKRDDRPERRPGQHSGQRPERQEDAREQRPRQPFRGPRPEGQAEGRGEGRPGRGPRSTESRPANPRAHESRGTESRGPESRGASRPARPGASSGARTNARPSAKSTSTSRSTSGSSSRPASKPASKFGAKGPRKVK